MKRCPACDGRAYYADVTCQRCGATIVPPPPVWIVRVGRVFWALAAVSIPLQLYHGARFVMRTEVGRDALGPLASFARYVVAHASDLAGAFVALIVVPLVGLYFFLRMMVDVGDGLELWIQRRRAERFRKHGW